MKKIFTIVCLACMTAIGAFAQGTVTVKSAEVDCGSSVTLTAEPATGYHFVNWTLFGSETELSTDNPYTITNISANADYEGHFAINVYNYKFVNWDNEELKVGTINHGEAPASPDATPTKPSTAQYDFEFSGWSPNIGPVIADNTVFTAQFTENLRSYTITFVNWDDTPLQSTPWDWGTEPVYSGETPTREEPGKTYTWTGWDKEISAVTGETTYKAVFSGVTNTYAITPHAGVGGTVSGGGDAIQYGQSVTITATPNECYQFVQWSDGNTEAERTFTVTGPVDVTAEFSKIKYTITVRSNNDSQGTVNVQEVTAP